MSSNTRHHHRFLLSLGLVLAFGAALPFSTGATPESSEPLPAAHGASIPTVKLRNHPPAWVAQAARKATAEPKPAAPAVVAPAPATHKPSTVKSTTPVAKYAGTNHLWIPSLGISHSVAGFACTRSTPPGPGVYRWGCAGKNNTYLFGHAWSTLKPLHDAYVSGHLHAGMVAYYADGSGHVRAYKVTAIKVVTPDQTAWAIAAQSVPSMTLQTCVGANSQYRLLVRLVATT